MHLQPLNSPAAWTVADIKKNTDWKYQLSAADIAELEAAIQTATATGKEIHVRGRGVVTAALSPLRWHLPPAVLPPWTR